MSDPKTPTPPGSTSQKWYRAGYQDALADIRRALESGGAAAVHTWITNNANQTTR